MAASSAAWANVMMMELGRWIGPVADERSGCWQDSVQRELAPILTLV
jgi:hypothetical protein